MSEEHLRMKYNWTVNEDDGQAWLENNAKDDGYSVCILAGFDAGPEPIQDLARYITEVETALENTRAQLSEALSQRQAAEEKLARWHEAMTDVSVINWTPSEENAEDIAMQLRDVITEAVRETLDPLVSEQAAKLKAELEEAERLREELGIVAEWVTTHLDRCAKTVAWRPDKAACTCGFDELRPAEAEG